jgi:hypothetical protein
MKKRILLSSLVVVLAVRALVEAPSPGPDLAGYMPAGPLLVLEASDFGSLLKDWNGSAEKQAWLASSNFEVFSRSRLYTRLAEAQMEFAAAAGLPPDMNLLESVAGAESALALYDIGNLQFLYVSKVPSARALETALWHTRSSYETRNAAGVDYFIRTDPASRRVAAFAAVKDYLLLATREDLMAGALTLLAGQAGATAMGERWYSETARRAGAPGDLRLVMNIPALARSPHFRSYWIQRNVSEVRGFGAGIADVHRTASQIREDRVFLRFDQPEAEPPDASTSAAMLRLIPDDAGFTQVWTRPAPAAALGLLYKKILAPGPGAPPPSLAAPPAAVSGIAGTESDLETRIDEPPLESPANIAVPPALRAMIESQPTAPLRAMLLIASSHTEPGGVFVGIGTAVVLMGSSDWDAVAVRKALADAPEFGLLGRIAVEARERVLILADSGALAEKIVARIKMPPGGQPVTYLAEFRHAAERGRFVKMMRLIDYSAADAGGDAREPRFFSENIGSLSGVLGRVESSSMTMLDLGGTVSETVTYRLAK